MEQALRITVYGPTGYTGLELLRVLAGHPRVNLVQVVSRSSSGKRLGEAVPHLSASPLANVPVVSEPEEDFDLAFLCLPHEASLDTVPRILAVGKRVVDLSGAYRMKNESAYPEYYGFVHTHPDLVSKSVYGLPEIFRDNIRGAELVSNPGCYPTAALLAMLPFLREGMLPDRVTVHGISGVSGAGRSPKQQFHFPEMEGNFFPYSVEKHRHVPEMEDVIRRITGREVKVRFTPTVVPAPRGMIVTLYLEADPVDLKEMFRETFKNEPFVRIVESPPMTRWVLGTSLCLIYPFYDPRTSMAVVISAIDNLGKGASHQAVQNMNLMFGFDEAEALTTTPIFP